MGHDWPKATTGRVGTETHHLILCSMVVRSSGIHLLPAVTLPYVHLLPAVTLPYVYRNMQIHLWVILLYVNFSEYSAPQ